MAKQPRRPSTPGNSKPQRKPAPPPPVAPVRSTYAEAVTVYEQAMRTLQQKNFARAGELLRQLIRSFPEERELLERARLYLALCERHTTPTLAEPQTVEEFLYAATLALNAAQFDRAQRYLDHVRREQPGNDQALYMLGVTHAQRGETELALRYLEQSFAANPENRVLARLDADLEDLRALEAASRLFGR
ncbi:MAG: tetratricopeptide repeat protein [Acidobacteriota bacterium]